MKQRVNLIGINILIEPIEFNGSKGAIIVPEEVKRNEVLQMGKVRQKGPGFLIPSPKEKDDMQNIIDGRDNDSLVMSFISLDIEEGDTAYFPKREAIDVRLDGTNYVIVPYTAIKMYIRDVK